MLCVVFQAFSFWNPQLFWSQQSLAFPHKNLVYNIIHLLFIIHSIIFYRFTKTMFSTSIVFFV